MTFRPTPSPLLVDVRPLCIAQKPPLPAILNAVSQLEPGQSLRLLAPFEPTPLYALLAQQGYSATPCELPDGTWQIDFTPDEDA